MLVLSRKAGDEIIIGDDIRLVVSQISGGRVSIGIQAPRDIHIVRGELPRSTFVEQTEEDSLVSVM